MEDDSFTLLHRLYDRKGRSSYSIAYSLWSHCGAPFPISSFSSLSTYSCFKSRLNSRFLHLLSQGKRQRYQDSLFMRLNYFTNSVNRCPGQVISGQGRENENSLTSCLKNTKGLSLSLSFQGTLIHLLSFLSLLSLSLLSFFFMVWPFSTKDTESARGEGQIDWNEENQSMENSMGACPWLLYWESQSDSIRNFHFHCQDSYLPFSSNALN